jgi:hypothetical protein
MKNGWKEINVEIDKEEEEINRFIYNLLTDRALVVV